MRSHTMDGRRRTSPARALAALAAAVLILAVLPAGAAGAEVVWLAPGGTDSATCGAAASPCRTLDGAVQVVDTGGVIKAERGTYPGTHAVITNTTVTIEGDYPGAGTSRIGIVDPSRTTFDADGAGRLLFVIGTGATEPTVTLDGLTVREGVGEPSGDTTAYIGGNVRVLDAHLVASDVHVEDGVAHLGDTKGNGYGGGIAVDTSSAGGTEGSSATLTRVRLTGNTARSYSGGSGDGGHGYGGAIYVAGSTQFGTSELTLRDSVVSGNVAGAARGGKDRMRGGGMYVSSPAAVSSSGTRWEANVARRAQGAAVGGFGALGGAVALDTEDNDIGDVAFVGDVFRDNVADTAGGTSSNDEVAGGAIGLTGRRGGTLVVEDATFERNVAQDTLSTRTRVAAAFGGAIAVQGPATMIVQLRGARFTDNRATRGSDDGARGSGGALAVRGASLDWVGGSSSGNRAALGGVIDTARGGTIYADDDSRVTTPGTGAVDVTSVAVLDDRPGESDGRGDVADVAGANATFTHVTVDGSDRAGAAAFEHRSGSSSAGRTRVVNAIVVDTPVVARNATSGADLVVVDTALVEPGTTVVVNGAQNDVSEGDPDLVDGAHLAEGSPAVDAARDADVRIDYEGNPRPLGAGPDLGADEQIPPDTDGDGVPNDADNCVFESNARQTDTDRDGLGDACDGTPRGQDGDDDGLGALDDNCPDDANGSQTDTDEDGAGDACDDTPDGADADGDGVGELADNCPDDANADQNDADADGRGDACDDDAGRPGGPGGGPGGGAPDADGDGAPDASDVCPVDADPDQADRDADGTGDACDEAPLIDEDPATTERLVTRDAVLTGIAVSGARFGDGKAGAVVLSRNDLFPDSLAGAILTADGPMLFTAPDALDPATRDEIERVLPAGGRIFLLGGAAALSPAVEEELRGAGYDVVRLSGDSRFQTAVVIARQALAERPSTRFALARAFGADGNPSSAWADSVTGGSRAAAEGVPVLLTGTEELHPDVAAFLAEQAPSEVALYGGEAALSAAVEQATPATRRVAGAERTATAVEIARLWGSGDRYVLFNGFEEQGWTVGLAAAGLAADLGAPLLVIGTEGVSEATASLISACGAATVETAVLGSTLTVPEPVLAEIDRLDGEGCP